MAGAAGPTPFALCLQPQCHAQRRVAAPAAARLAGGFGVVAVLDAGAVGFGLPENAVVVWHCGLCGRLHGLVNFVRSGRVA